MTGDESVKRALQARVEARVKQLLSSEVDDDPEGFKTPDAKRREARRARMRWIHERAKDLRQQGIPDGTWRLAMVRAAEEWLQQATDDDITELGYQRD